MVKITVQADCGNSPKKEFIRDFNIAFAKNDISYILDRVSDDIVWTIIGDREITGREAFEEALTAMSDVEQSELILHNIITHGREASANGEMISVNGELYAFCDVYNFTNTKGTSLRAITSYVIKKAT